MKNGTVLAYLKTNELGEVDRLVSSAPNHPRISMSHFILKLLEIAQGLDFLHSLNIVHGDLRGTNILISDNFSACIADFGLTTIPGVETTMESDSPASIHWAAPELFDPAAFGCDRCIRAASSDVYAFACVCVEVSRVQFSHDFIF
jgi:serine/threonine protein kinase